VNASATADGAAASASAASPLLSLRQVSKRFANGVTAIGGVSLDIASGAFVSVLGPSGCGKSTLLRLVAGLSQPSAGRIEWPGQSGGGSAGPRHDIGFVFQEATLMPWATALANVMLPLRLARVRKSEARERALAMLSLVGLRGFEHARPRELSGGMRMRVSIARALVTRPKILLMDEPFAALDEIARHKLNDDLLSLWRRDRFTAIFVTHSVFESVYLSERVVVMAARPGRMIADLPVDAAYPREALFRTSADYARLCRSVSAALKTAIDA